MPSRLRGEKYDNEWFIPKALHSKLALRYLASGHRLLQSSNNCAMTTFAPAPLTDQ